MENKKLEVLAIIPARGGSKGIPRKNIKLLGDRPLIDYTIKAAHGAKCITRTILSTEDEKIKEVAQGCGCEVLNRPMELAQDETMSIDVLINVVETLEKTEGYVPDVTILLQATCPLRDSKQIDEAFDVFENNDCDSVFAVKPRGITHSFWRENHDGTYQALYDFRTRPRRQDTHRHYKIWGETGSIYIIKTDVMKKVHDFVGDKPQIYKSPISVDIDTPDDFDNILKIMQNSEK